MKAFDGVPDSYVYCRTMGHSWDSIPYDGGGPRALTRSRSAVTALLRCTVCRGKRYDIFSSVSGKLIDRDYDMPDDYKLSGDVDASRPKMRVESIQRGLLFLAEDAPARPRLFKAS